MLSSLPPQLLLLSVSAFGYSTNAVGTEPLFFKGLLAQIQDKYCFSCSKINEFYFYFQYFKDMATLPPKHQQVVYFASSMVCLVFRCVSLGSVS